MKCLAGWSTSWNQNCWEKYQWPQVHRWHHPYGRKQRRDKEPLDEGEREEWRCWLKTQHSKNEDHGIWSITSWKIDGETMETVINFIFGGSKITADGDCSHEIKRCLLLGRKAVTNLDSIIKKQRHYFVNKGPYSQSYGFSSNHVWLWELDYKENWAL